MKSLALLLLIISCNAAAGLESSPDSPVKQIVSFSTYGNGDVVVILESNGAACATGYWLNRSDPGFSTNLQMIIAAFHHDSKLKLRGDTGKLWQGSEQPYCYLYSVEYR